MRFERISIFQNYLNYRSKFTAHPYSNPGSTKLQLTENRQEGLSRQHKIEFFLSYYQKGTPNLCISNSEKLIHQNSVPKPVENPYGNSQ